MADIYQGLRKPVQTGIEGEEYQPFLVETKASVPLNEGFDFTFGGLDINLPSVSQEQTPQQEAEVVADPTQSSSDSVSLPSIAVPQVDVSMPSVDVSVPQIDLPSMPDVQAPELDFSTRPFADAVVELANQTGEALDTVANPIARSVGEFVEPVVDVVADTASQVVETVADIATETVRPAVELATEVVKPAIDVATETIDKMSNVLGDELKEFVSSADFSFKDTGSIFQIKTPEGFLDISKYINKKFSGVTESLNAINPIKDMPVSDFLQAVNNPQGFMDNIAKDAGSSFLKNIGINDNLIKPLMDIASGKLGSVIESFAVGATGGNPLMKPVVELVGNVGKMVVADIIKTGVALEQIPISRSVDWTKDEFNKIVNDRSDNSLFNRAVDYIEGGNTVSRLTKMAYTMAITETLVKDLGFAQMRNEAKQGDLYYRKLWNEKLAPTIAKLSSALVDGVVQAATIEAGHMKYNKAIESANRIKDLSASEHDVMTVLGRDVDVNKFMDYQNTMKKMNNFNSQQEERGA